MCKNTCCFFGHRTINETEEIKAKLIEIIENLIMEKNVAIPYIVFIPFVPGLPNSYPPDSR